MRFVFLMISMFCFSVSAVDLSQINVKSLHGKTVAYYMGSFDPFHNGHAEVVEHLLQKADYVLIVPAGIPDKRKPNRTDPQVRREMIARVYKDHERVLTSRLNPWELQGELWDDMPHVTFVGVQGSEILDEFAHASPKASAIYLRGKRIPAEMADTAIAAMMMVKADKLFVPLRDPESVWATAEAFHDFEIEAIQLSQGCGDISSTSIKKAIRQGDAYSQMVPEGVVAYISEAKIYHQDM